MACEASSPDLSLTREATGQHDSEPNDARTADVLDAGNCIGGKGKNIQPYTGLTNLMSF